MKNYAKSLIFIIMLSSIQAGCQNYEHGPAFSLKSKIERLDELWIIQNATDLKTNQDITSKYFDVIWKLNENGRYKENDVLKGSWNLTNNDEYLTITMLTGEVFKYKILRLSSHELWLTIENELELKFECY
jgi:hypothetical protein